MCWSAERTNKLSELIESNGLDCEITSVDIANELWISRVWYC